MKKLASPFLGLQPDALYAAFTSGPKEHFLLSKAKYFFISYRRIKYFKLSCKLFLNICSFVF